MSKKTNQKNIPNLTAENSVAESKDLDTPISTIDLNVASNSKSKKIGKSAAKFEVSITSKAIDVSLEASNLKLGVTQKNKDLVVGIKDQNGSLEIHKTIGKPLNIQSSFLTESTANLNGSTIASSLSGKSMLSSELVNFSLVQEKKERIKAVSSSDSDTKLDQRQVTLTDQISASLKFSASEKNPQLTIENAKTIHQTIHSDVIFDEKGQIQKIIDSTENKKSGGFALGLSNISVFFQHQKNDARHLANHVFHKTEEQQRLELGVNQKGPFIKVSENFVDTIKNSGQKIDLTISDHLEASLKAHGKGVSAEFGVATKSIDFNQMASVSGKVAYESDSQTSYLTYNQRGKNQTYGIGTAHNLGGGVCFNASIETGNHTPTTAKLQLNIPLGSTSGNHKKDCDVKTYPQPNLSSTENLKRALQQIPFSIEQNNASRGL